MSTMRAAAAVAPAAAAPAPAAAAAPPPPLPRPQTRVAAGSRRRACRWRSALRGWRPCPWLPGRSGFSRAQASTCAAACLCHTRLTARLAESTSFPAACAPRLLPPPAHPLAAHLPVQAAGCPQAPLGCWALLRVCPTSWLAAWWPGAWRASWAPAAVGAYPACLPAWVPALPFCLPACLLPAWPRAWLHRCRCVPGLPHVSSDRRRLAAARCCLQACLPARRACLARWRAAAGWRRCLGWWCWAFRCGGVSVWRPGGWRVWQATCRMWEAPCLGQPCCRDPGCHRPACTVLTVLAPSFLLCVSPAPRLQWQVYGYIPSALPDSNCFGGQAAAAGGYATAQAPAAGQRAFPVLVAVDGAEVRLCACLAAP